MEEHSEEEQVQRPCGRRKHDAFREKNVGKNSRHEEEGI